jgi:hypothetical protein
MNPTGALARVCVFVGLVVLALSTLYAAWSWPAPKAQAQVSLIPTHSADTDTDACHADVDVDIHPTDINAMSAFIYTVEAQRGRKISSRDADSANDLGKNRPHRTS